MKKKCFFVNDDAGIPIKYEISKENWYDPVKLNQVISNLPK